MQTPLPHRSVNNDSGNLAAITTLAAIGILTGNDELVQASLSDLISAPPHTRRVLDPTGDVDRLLMLNALYSVGIPSRTNVTINYLNYSA